MTEPVYEQKALIYKALAHPIRVQIVEYLALGEKSVSEIVEHVGAKKSNTSRHLAVLRAAGVVETRKDGLAVYYNLRLPCLMKMCSCVNEALLKKAEYHKKIARNVRR
jgi:ArsR family transcriptional regulator